MRKNYIPKKPDDWVIGKINRCLSLDPVHDLIWSSPDATSVKPGQKAGTLSEGHVQVGFGLGLGKRGLRKTRVVRAHHIVWYLTTGEWPPAELDHIDKNEQNNQFDNLRLATHSENNRNRTAQKNNKLGVKNIHFEAERDKFMVGIKLHGKHVCHERYDTLEEAIEARDKALADYHGDFACMD